ncbi:hypothetical protein C2845_PM12G05480 [Panicum miliaceum]|uniref:TMV response-related protein n=1 Tax=Panicum miliaceum TaxID=4540 RepID=A0A3L6QCG5_PANMI|nr:hypothetical protein C2845_PM12G05480 [Panicum miliaceum]
MGSALSCIFHASSVSGDAQQPARPAAPPARVIAADGSLKELPISDPPLASASDVLGSDAAAAASSSFFVCNSDALYFGEPPPALGAERLRPGQMYFVLPAAMLGRALSSADMAALAARAIAALPPEKPRRRRGRGRAGLVAGGWQGRRGSGCVPRGAERADTRGVRRGHEPGEERRQGGGGGGHEKGEAVGAEEGAEHDSRGSSVRA